MIIRIDWYMRLQIRWQWGGSSAVSRISNNILCIYMYIYIYIYMPLYAAVYISICYNIDYRLLLLQHHAVCCCMLPLLLVAPAIAAPATATPALLLLPMLLLPMLLLPLLLLLLPMLLLPLCCCCPSLLWHLKHLLSPTITTSIASVYPPHFPKPPLHLPLITAPIPISAASSCLPRDSHFRNANHFLNIKVWPAADQNGIPSTCSIQMLIGQQEYASI